MVKPEKVIRSLSYPQFLHGLYHYLEAAGIARSSSHITAGIKSGGEGADEAFGSPETSIEVGRVIDFIEEHAVESISLEMLAEEAHLSNIISYKNFGAKRGLLPGAMCKGIAFSRQKSC